MFSFLENSQILVNFSGFGKFSEFWKILRISKKNKIFEFGRSFSVGSCLLIALIKCLNGSKSLGLLFVWQK